MRTKKLLSSVIASTMILGTLSLGVWADEEIAEEVEEIIAEEVITEESVIEESAVDEEPAADEGAAADEESAADDEATEVEAQESAADETAEDTAEVSEPEKDTDEPGDEPEEEPADEAEEITAEETDGEEAEAELAEEPEEELIVVAQIADVTYESLQAAVDEAESGAEIVLAQNAEENIVISSEKNIILDLNGYTLTGLGDAAVVVNEGTLVIRDGSYEQTGIVIGAVENGTEAACIIEGGTYTQDVSKYIADGCVIMQKDNNYTVISDMSSAAAGSYKSAVVDGRYDRLEVFRDITEPVNAYKVTATNKDLQSAESYMPIAAPQIEGAALNCSLIVAGIPEDVNVSIETVWQESAE